MIAHLKGREKALEEQFGLKPADAEWVALVALHSGVFLRAQHQSWTGGSGSTPRSRSLRLVKNLKALGLAAEDYDLAGIGLACRVFAKSVYRALGAENIRHRRKAAAPHMVRRLLSLDAVLDEPDRPWLPTEPEKVGAFTALGIDRAILPARVYGKRRSAKGCRNGPSKTVRPFGWKMPVAVAPGPEGYALFVFVDTVEAETHSELKTWGAEHARLWAALRELGIRVEAVAVSPAPERVEGLGRELRSWATREAGPSGSAVPHRPLEELQAAEAALRELNDAAMRRWGGFQGTLERVAELQGLRSAAPAARNGKPSPRLDSGGARLVQTKAIRGRE